MDEIKRKMVGISKTVPATEWFYSIHWGLVTPYNDIDLGQQRLR